MAGYSATPLARKLGIKPGYRVKTKRAPGNYQELLSPLPDDVQISPRLRDQVDLWHLFTRNRAEVGGELKRAMKEIRSDGTIWVSWPKKTSGVESDMTEGAIRDAALPLGLVDIKVCAVDEIWSGLKLVIRKHLR